MAEQRYPQGRGLHPCPLETTSSPSCVPESQCRREARRTAHEVIWQGAQRPDCLKAECGTVEGLTGCSNTGSHAASGGEVKPGLAEVPKSEQALFPGPCEGDGALTQPLLGNGSLSSAVCLLVHSTPFWPGHQWVAPS